MAYRPALPSHNARSRSQSSQEGQFPFMGYPDYSAEPSPMARERSASTPSDFCVPEQAPQSAPCGRRVRLPSLNSPRFRNQEDVPTASEMAARLALLLHARVCRKSYCGVRNCDVARGVLDHCQECFLDFGMCHSSCSQAKTLLRHFRICKTRSSHRACHICSTLRRDYPWALAAAHQHSQSGHSTPTHQQAPSTSSAPLPSLPSLTDLCCAATMQSGSPRAKFSTPTTANAYRPQC
ncbi:TPA: hypothetical protein N0F65_008996 [Lagenidium giganteum]|uniref:TAZ-type domain-containing protein n=1 Tax=Lagenidium giganteum TaxID=4803 RepID=A0AAV2YN02_9STRA|nr:TPA: hypothetical protein N0F65_008996 [Lagenidium giganteum]